MSKSEKPAVTLEPGLRIDERYEILGVLGGGAMGAVYDAYHLNLERRVAIKVLHEQRLRDEGMRQRFDREARTLAAVSHPNIVGVTDYGFWEDEPYIVMERLHGRNLQSLLKTEGALSPRRTADFMLQLLGALEHAHERKLVHRDLKPGNVWVEESDAGRERLRLLDFGFAKFVDDRVNVTADGIVMGTPLYMSPEQASAAPADARSDVYSAGALMFHMITGRPPFEGKSARVIRGHLHEEPPSLVVLRPGLHPRWAEIAKRALQKKPSERFQSAAEFARAIVLLPRDAVSGDVPGPPAAPRAGDTVPNLGENAKPKAPARSRGRRLVIAVATLIAIAALGAAAMVVVPPLLATPEPTAEVASDPVEEVAPLPERIERHEATEIEPVSPDLSLPPDPWETLPRSPRRRRRGARCRRRSALAPLRARAAGRSAPAALARARRGRTRVVRGRDRALRALLRERSRGPRRTRDGRRSDRARARRGLVGAGRGARPPRVRASRAAGDRALARRQRRLRRAPRAPPIDRRRTRRSMIAVAWANGPAVGRAIPIAGPRSASPRA
jgi:tRNA A-37 threonylcarbamoyl transferase component Bud32